MLHNGVDIVEIERVVHAIDRWGERFLRRVFTEGERISCGGRAASLAARFAAKEAVAKLLGVGIRGLGAGEHAIDALGWHDIEITRAPNGRPEVQLHARAAERAAMMGIGPIALSMSHSRDYAVASAVAEARS